MEQDYIRAPLGEMGIVADIPGDEDRAITHRIIYEELIRGVMTERSREAFLAIIATGREAGADSVILGCTEIGLLVNADNSPLPVYDTMALHAGAISDFILYGV
jgi:aspartate racemase